MENPILSTKGRHKRKATSPLRSRGGGKVPKTTKVRRPLPGCSRKKPSPKSPSLSVKSKKSRLPVLNSHFHRPNRALNRNKNEPTTTTKAKRPLQGRSRKRASPKTPSPSTKSKKSRRPILYGHYHRLQETLNRYENESEEGQEHVERPGTSNDYWGSWTL